MNLKNTASIVIIIAITTVLNYAGMTFYAKKVSNPVLIEAIKTETTKIENNLDTKIDNKFKKIERLEASLPYVASLPSSIDASKGRLHPCIVHQDSVIISKSHLTNKQKRRLGIK